MHLECSSNPHLQYRKPKVQISQFVPQSGIPPSGQATQPKLKLFLNPDVKEIHKKL
jgi:hypothetical protein